MMGKHQLAPKLYYELSLDRLVPYDHLLRQISRAIDFSFIYPLARPYYSYTGQPSVDPIVLFKTLLVGYLNRDCGSFDQTRNAGRNRMHSFSPIGCSHLAGLIPGD